MEAFFLNRSITTPSAPYDLEQDVTLSGKWNLTLTYSLKPSHRDASGCGELKIKICSFHKCWRNRTEDQPEATTALEYAVIELCQ